MKSKELVVSLFLFEATMQNPPRTVPTAVNPLTRTANDCHQVIAAMNIPATPPTSHDPLVAPRASNRVLDTCPTKPHLRPSRHHRSSRYPYRLGPESQW